MRKLIITIFVLFVVSGCSDNEDYGLMCDINKAASEITNDIDDNPNYYHTLIDINQDGTEELIVEHYGMAGSGLKYLTDIFYLNDSLCKYVLNDELSNLSNITLDSSYIYSFYIANGGGEANKYQWEGNSIKPIEKYIINILNEDGDSIIVKYSNYLTNKTDSIYWDKVNLPTKYHYNNYTPVLME